MNNNAPVQFVSNKNKNNPPKSWNAKKSAPVTLNTHQGEFEFHKTQHNPPKSNAKQAHFFSNGPVDVDEAIQDEEKNNLFVTALAERSTNVEQNNQWNAGNNAPPQASSEQNAWNQDQGWNQRSLLVPFNSLKNLTFSTFLCID